MVNDGLSNGQLRLIKWSVRVYQMVNEGLSNGQLGLIKWSMTDCQMAS